MDNVMRENVLDLSSLKSVDPEKQAEEAHKELIRNGFLCGCGNRVAENGIQLFGMWTGVTPSGSGSYQNVAMICTQIFCGLGCATVPYVLEHGIGFEIQSPTGKVEGTAEVFASKPAVINWFDLNPPGV